MNWIREFYSYLTGFRKEKKELRLLIDKCLVRIDRLWNELKIEKTTNSNRRFLAEALDRYNAASRARVYPGASKDILRDKQRYSEEVIIQQTALIMYLSEHLKDDVIPYYRLSIEELKKYRDLAKRHLDLTT